MRLAVVGKPMSGKGTQAKMLSKATGIPHISVGQLLRDQVKNKTKFGKQIERQMEIGDLVPSEKVVQLLEKKLPRKGFILDGFPRSEDQAKMFDKFAKFDLVINVKCSDETVIERVMKRRMCSDCGSIYGLDFPPKKKGVCDKCGGKLYQRLDDNKRTIRKRLKVFYEQTEPVIKYYKKQKLVWDVNGEKPIESIHKSILKKIEKIK